MKLFRTSLAALAGITALALAFTAAPEAAQAKNVASADCYVTIDGGNCQEVSENYGQPTVRTAHPTQINAASGNVANASAVATIAAASGKTNYINGFTCTASGATAASVVSVTVTGILGGTITYTFVAPAGVTLQANTLAITFPEPLVASAANTAIVVTLPALGSGNTNAACSAHGFRL